ncbi:hypothetical protein RvY_09868 [Ramazzottius varieornatus]|uniref:Ion transport domain-containing protein n=1 Tax=Ramazzottius varieornatus TaxID=947166 RepID=A0A1D1VD80_RAMVA|nr:hypothetical protein RvY_09868 [Ramazzottius varieornatus]
MAFREDFGFTTPESPKIEPPDLLDFSLVVDDIPLASRVYEPDIGAALLANASAQRWDFVDRTIRLFEKSVLHADGNAEFIRNALNYADQNGSGNFLLLHLVEHNKRNLVERCINLGADVLKQATDGTAAIHIAASHSKLEMILDLFRHGADPMVQGGVKTQLPLHMACMRKYGALPTVQLLLENSQEDGRLTEDADGFTPLWRGVQAVNIPVIKELLKEHSYQQLALQNPVHKNDTVAHYALTLNQTTVFFILLEEGAPANIQNNDQQTLLHLAVLHGNSEAVEYLRARSADTMLLDRYERSPIADAVERGDHKIIESLISAYPESIRYRTKDGSTLCHLAALSGHPETVILLLSHGVYLHMPNKFGAVALHAASRAGHAGVVKALLKRGAKIDAQTKDGYTSLHIAIEYGKFRCVEVLIGDGASVHIKGGKAGETPLIIASRVPNSEQSVDLLIKSGAQVNARMTNGETALMVASRAGSLNMAALLMKNGAEASLANDNGETALHGAVRSNNYELCRTLLEYIAVKHGADVPATIVNLQNLEGETCVHYAAELISPVEDNGRSSRDMMLLMLRYGGEVHLQTKLTYETPLMYAARAGNNPALKDIFTALPPAKIQYALGRQSKIGWTAVHAATDMGLHETVKLLLKNNARIDVFDDQGKAALHIAAENGFVEILDLLLRSKAFVNSKTRSGFSALHLATMKGHTEMIHLLVEKHHAAVDVMSMLRQTPLHLAAKYKQPAIFQLLLQLGADPNIQDQNGQTPLFLATALDSVDVVALVLNSDSSNPLMRVDSQGLNVAHLAAKNGAAQVMDLLLERFPLQVISSQVESTEMKVVHFAAAEGHGEVLGKLVDAGASVSDEDKDGMNAVMHAAKNGHLTVLDVLQDRVSWNGRSIKTGLTALHLAAFWGEAETVQELLTKVAPGEKTAKPTVETATVRLTETEAGLTAVHFAAKAGHDNVVRLLLNYPQVELEARGEITGYTPLHMVALGGSIPPAVLLIAKSEACLSSVDKRGRNAMLVAAAHGKKDLCLYLISQGIDINAVDALGWSAVHHAAANSHLDVVKALVEQGADPQILSNDDKSPLAFAASSGNIGILNYLFSTRLNFEQLIQDHTFLVNLMQCAKPLNQLPLETFVVNTNSPVEAALQLTSFYRTMAVHDRARALDLEYAARYCETLANRLLTLACSRTKHPEVIFQSVDSKGETLLDLILDGQHKVVASLTDVQKHIMNLWKGGLELSDLQTFFIIIMFLVLPPTWITYNLPFKHRFKHIPLFRLLSNLAGSILFIVLLVFTFLTPNERLYERKSMAPNVQEWILIVWLVGLVLHEFTRKEERTGFGRLQLFVIILCVIGFIIQISAIPFPNSTQVTLLYIRAQFFATASLLSHIQLLSYMAFHRLFGPLSIVIGEIFRDLITFLVLLGCFLLGFTFAFSALYSEVYKAGQVAHRHHGGPLLFDATTAATSQHGPALAASHQEPHGRASVARDTSRLSAEDGLVGSPPGATATDEAQAHHKRPKRQVSHSAPQSGSHGTIAAHPSTGHVSPVKAGHQEPNHEPAAHGSENPSHGAEDAGHGTASGHSGQAEHGQGGHGGGHEGSHGGAGEHGGGEEHEDNGFWPEAHFVYPGPGPILNRVGDPVVSLEYMIWGIWMLIDPMENPTEESYRSLHPLPLQDQIPNAGNVWLRILVGVYLFVVWVVLLKLFIAMMVDSYERIKRSSDTEWRYGRARLIFGLSISEGTPAPLNLVSYAVNGVRYLYSKYCDSSAIVSASTSRTASGLDRRTSSRLSSNLSTGKPTAVKEIVDVIDWKDVVRIYNNQNKREMQQGEDTAEFAGQI